MSNFIKSYQANVGLNHVPAYQVSGQPFASGSIESVLTSFSCSTQSKIEFISLSKSLASSSDSLILASFAILFIVFVSNFNLYVSSD